MTNSIPTSNLLDKHLQTSMMQLIDHTPNFYGFHIPNGGSRHLYEAMNLKRQGVKAGVADIVLLCQNGVTVFLEVKTSKGKLSIHQENFKIICEKLNFNYHAVRSLEDVESILKKYT